MNRPESIYAVFAPLGIKLTHLESLNLNFNPEKRIPIEDLIVEDDCYLIMHSIRKEIHYWDPKIVHPVVRNYYKRVDQLNNSILKNTNEAVINVKKDKDLDRQISRHSQFVDNVKSEVQYYMHELQQITTSLGESLDKKEVENEQAPIESNGIEIIGKVTVEKLKGYFNQDLHYLEIALFLHYLRAGKYLINYTNTSLGLVAKNLFAGSDMVRQSFSKLRPTENPEELKRVLKMLDELKALIKADLDKIPPQKLL